MFSIFHRVALVAFGFGWLLLTGCSDKFGGRLEVSGTVMLKGEPLKDGAIRFIPQDKQGSESGGPITNGQFQLPQDAGLKPGKYLVQITAADGKTPTDEEAGGPGGSTNIVSVDLIPPEWNEASTQVIEVKAGQKNTFKFDIPTIRDVKKKKN